MNGRLRPGSATLAPVPLGVEEPNATPFLALILLGFLVGALGHAHKSKPVIAFGIILILAATLVFQLQLYRAGN